VGRGAHRTADVQFRRSCDDRVQGTAGLSSSNRTIPLPAGAIIQLTTGIEADRTGKQYGEKVDPDEIIPAGARIIRGGKQAGEPSQRRHDRGCQGMAEASCGK